MVRRVPSLPSIVKLAPMPDRLESWKEIAEYLHRDVRTVQRWEQSKGLPVRRLPAGSRARVFAIRSELDDWWNSRGIQVSLEEESNQGALVQKLWWHRLIWAFVVAGTLLLATIAYWYFSVIDRPQLLRVTPLTSLPGLVHSPSFSPDGRQVAFIWRGPAADNFDLYIKDLTVGEPRRLTTDPATECCPAWSPNGHVIGFLRFRLSQLTAGPEVLIVPQSGGAERVVIEGIPFPPELDPHPIMCWTPDSRNLIAGVPDLSTPMSLYLISIETMERRRLTAPPPTSSGDDSAVISPDGTRLAFIRRLGPGGGNVFVLHLNADFTARGEPLQLTHEPCCVSNPLWTGDGKEILYVKQEDAASIAYRIPAGGGRSRAVSSIGASAPYLRSSITASLAQLSISPQGDKLVYVGGTTRSDLWRADLAGRQPDGSIPSTPWLPSSSISCRPQISPDGRRVAFVSSRGGNLDIWVANADGSNALQVTSLRGPEAHAPRWSPDSKRLVFHANLDGYQHLYVVDAEGGKPTRLTRGLGNNMWASWSQDGRWIYFTSNRTSQYQCWRVPAAGGEAIQITKYGGYGGFESSDGQFLYYPKHYMIGEIWCVPVTGGEETQVGKSVLSHRGPANYAVRPEGIYTFSIENPLRGVELQLYRFATGKVEILGTISEGLGRGGMTISPDGRWLLFTDYDRKQGDLMLVENFR